jgi:hypothetical protein
MSDHVSDTSAIHQMLRREFMRGCSVGLGSMALGSLLCRDGFATPIGSVFQSPLTPKRPHHAPRAKAVIQLFMAGGPSQLDLFDYKPKLQALSGETVPKSLVEGQRFAFLKDDAKLLGTKRKFNRHGQSGAEISELLPHTAAVADDLAIIRTTTTDVFNHGPAKLLYATGFSQFGKPAAGAWITYGLGSESENLPGFVVLSSGPRGPRGGAQLWSNGFLPSAYQGVPFQPSGDPVVDLSNPPGVTPARQRRTLDAVNRLNTMHYNNTGDDEIAGRMAAYEMAFRMQSSAPSLIDLNQESAATLALYGAKPGKPSFANNCLLARRLVEQGVRYVCLFHTDWDHHGGKENLDIGIEKTCRETDQPCAALIQDLKQRGLLDETLVMWGGEFGRTPMGQSVKEIDANGNPVPIEERSKVGRDHHIQAYTTWLAGGGVKGGQTIGETDELGLAAVEKDQRVHVHDLQATMLHLLGLDHLQLTYRFQGRQFRLTDVGGEILRRIIA